MTTLQEGWVYHEEPWSTDPTLTALFQFGLISEDRNMNVGSQALDVSYTEVEKFNQYYPDIQIGNSPADNVPTRYVLVNGIALYWLMGKAFEIVSFTVASASNFEVDDVITGGTSAATGVLLSISTTTFRVKVTSGTFVNGETITEPVDGSTTISTEPATDGKYITYFDGSVRKPRIAIWEQSANRKYHYYGITAESLVLEFVNGSLSSSMQSKGMKHGISSITPTFSFPNSITSFYSNITNTTWNSIALDLNQFRLNLATTLKPIWDAENGYYKDINEFKMIRGSMNIQIESEQMDLIAADAVFPPPERTFTFYIFKTNTGDTDKYIKVNAQAHIIHLDYDRSAGDPVTYNLVLLIASIYFEVKDGVDLSFYQLS